MKAVFPVAGFGTRFLPATKSTPKEMLPVVDRPLIQYAIEEAAAAGITDMIFITGRNKHAIEDYFDRAYELETELSLKGDSNLLEQLRSIIPNGVNFVFIRQGVAAGLGHAVMCARPAVGDSAFAVILADELLYSASGTPNATQQLMAAHERTKRSVIGVGNVTGRAIESYGCVAVSSTDESGLMTLNGIVEKPKFADAPSRYAAFGRYIFPSDFFAHLEDLAPGRAGEIQLTDGIASAIAHDGAFAVNMDVVRYDCGTKLGLLEANLDFALRHPELGSRFRELIESRR